jgi:hypothetical protein
VTTVASPLGKSGPLLCFASSASGAPIVIDGPTTDWTAISYPVVIPDWSDDEQTGDTESDVVGNALRAALYITSTQTWGALGALSDPYTPTGVLVSSRAAQPAPAGARCHAARLSFRL